MSKKNIITGVVAVLALVLVVFVVLIETGVVNTRTLTQPQTVIESEIIVVSETNEDGEIEYITMVTKYSRPKVTSNYRYPTKKTTTTQAETTTTIRYVEQSSYVHITDANGIPQFNDDGTPVTEVVTYTIAENSLTQPATAAPKTSAVAVTSPDGVVQTDVSGNPVTEVVTYIETTTKGPDIWSENTQEGTTRGGLNIETDVKRDDSLAQAIVDQINADRQAQGLEPLEHATNLKASARTNSMALALPEIYGNNSNSAAYTLITKYGGNPVYQQVAAANRDKIMSADTTQIGVGVVKYNDQYYTSVIFG